MVTKKGKHLATCLPLHCKGTALDKTHRNLFNRIQWSGNLKKTFPLEYWKNLRTTLRKLIPSKKPRFFNMKSLTMQRNKYFLKILIQYVLLLSTWFTTTTKKSSKKFKLYKKQSRTQTWLRNAEWIKVKEFEEVQESNKFALFKK